MTVPGILKDRRFLLSLVGVAVAVAAYYTGSEAIGNIITSSAEYLLHAVGL
jgi:hypothetical protein